jgi:hypothetical protein
VTGHRARQCHWRAERSRQRYASLAMGCAPTWRAGWPPTARARATFGPRSPAHEHHASPLGDLDANKAMASDREEVCRSVLPFAAGGGPAAGPSPTCLVYQRFGVSVHPRSIERALRRCSNLVQQPSPAATELVEARYEQLREQVLQASHVKARPAGVAAVLHQGLWSWIVLVVAKDTADGHVPPTTIARPMRLRDIICEEQEGGKRATGSDGETRESLASRVAQRPVMELRGPTSRVLRAAGRTHLGPEGVWVQRVDTPIPARRLEMTTRAASSAQREQLQLSGRRLARWCTCAVQLGRDRGGIGDGTDDAHGPAAPRAHLDVDPEQPRE